MARKYDFKPDRPQITLADRLYLTKKQRTQLLKWSLYAVMLLVLSVVQDVLLSRMRLFGATTELVPVGIFIIGLLEGLETGSVFSLVAACLYHFSGTPGGTYSIVFITAYCVLVTLLRQAYLQKGFFPALLCTTVAMILYEVSVFLIGLFLGLTTPDRLLGFLLTTGLSLLVAPALYPIALVIGKIGGEVWKE